MPKIQWTDLPVPLRDHLFDRARERKISADDLYDLKLWRESIPKRFYSQGNLPRAMKSPDGSTPGADSSFDLQSAPPDVRGRTPHSALRLQHDGFQRLPEVPSRPTYSLERLVAKITPQNRHNESDWGPPVGDEAW